jgi:alpha/beta hydrolase family protein
MKRTIALCVTLVVLGAPAEARITALTVDKVEPFADGAAFGAVGAYERVIGTAKGELDPADPRNRGIVNLDKAPRNARGMVEYDTDVFILRPADGARGNHKLFYEVNNRGRKFLTHWLMDAPAANANDPRTTEDAGNALLFRLGFTMVWSGWDPDAPRANNGMAMHVPVAQQNGRAIIRTIRDELVSGTRAPEVAAFKLSYAAASLDTAKARLTLRAKEAEPERLVPAEGWAFVDERTIKLLPDGTKPPPGALYELTYDAIGFAATRDLVSYLRYTERDRRTPFAVGGIKEALAFGISQSGRYLRDFIAQGFNQDEAQNRVFDGVLTHISGVGRVFLNVEFGQPFRTNTQHEDHLMPENEFPFSTATLDDPVTGRHGSLFRHDGFDPKLIEVNTSTEYWQKGASLLTTDPLGTRDIDLPAEARVFMVTGTQHAGRVGLTPAAGPCINPRNPHNPSAALRALLVDLDEWVEKGTAPPASRVPRLADGTLVAPDATGLPAIPEFYVVRAANAIARFGDWVHPKPEGGTQYRPLVAKVGVDANELAGIRLPDIAAPLATYTGWNAYKAPFPEGELCDRDGSYAVLATSKAERAKSGDPRPSLEELYGDHAGYVAKLTAAADALVRERLLLPEDAQRYIAAAERDKSF